MHRKLLPTLFVCSLGIVAVAYAYPKADEPTPRQRAVADMAAKFEYSGGNRAKEYNAGEIYQSITTTTDDLKKVSLWFREQMHIHDSTSEGAEYTRRPDLNWDRGSTVFHDGYRPKPNGEKGLDIRADTMFSFVYRIPEMTVVVVINRAAEDKLTVVSLTVVPGKADAKKPA